MESVRRKTTGESCQVLNFTQKKRCGDFYSRGKGFKNWERNDYNYVNISLHTVIRCGKENSLWKSLWRMWKTLNYQQIIRSRRRRTAGCKNASFSCIFLNPVSKSACYVPGGEKNSKGKRSENVCFLEGRTSNAREEGRGTKKIL